MQTALPRPYSGLILSESRNLRYFTFFYLYIMQGIPSAFALTAVANYLTAEGINTRAIGQFVALVGLPWGFKFVWGPLIDRYRSSTMGIRKPWVIGTQLLALLATTLITTIQDPVAQFTAMGWAFAIHGLFASVQDVSVDAMAITIVPESERGRVNGFMRAGMLIGQAIGAAGLAYLIRQEGFRTAAYWQTGLLAVMTLITFFIREQPTDSLIPTRTVPQPVGMQASRTELPFGQLLRQLTKSILAPQSILLFGAIGLVYVCESVFRRAYNTHLIQELRWPDTDVSLMSGTYGTVFAFTIALLGGLWSDRVGANRMLITMMGVMAAFFVGFNALAGWWINTSFATTGILIRQALEPVFSIGAMPVLMNLCRRGVEGSQFALYMALSNQADILGALISGYALSYFTTPAIGLMCGVLVVLALVVVRSRLRTT